MRNGTEKSGQSVANSALQPFRVAEGGYRSRITDIFFMNSRITEIRVMNNLDTRILNTNFHENQCESRSQGIQNKK